MSSPTSDTTTSDPIKKDPPAHPSLNIVCPFCQAHFKRSPERQQKKPLAFCAYCGTKLTPLSTTQFQQHGIVETPPNPEEVLFQVGRYLILKSIGKGGMGEVFLSYDQVAGRRVALKKIRSEYIDSERLKSRFLREARITSQLIHPSIIPIYSIHEDGTNLYYTMPFVEGKTLRQILDSARKLEETEGAKRVENSIPSLMRVFSSVVQAIAYAHSKGVLHRDIKPENIMVGKYGEVIILDWGLTKIIEEPEDDMPEEHVLKELPEAFTRRSKMLTKLGKIVGTISYMAPERAQKLPASIQTDIYALGVILYQILTLSMPFQRKTIEDFTANFHKEELTAAELRAPYRDVPPILSEMVKTCLSETAAQRYQSCDELLQHIESYLEGRSEWFHIKSLSITEKADWEFQEHVLLAEHSAITRSTDISEWVMLMISKDSFAENVRMECKITLGSESQGIGFLLSIPEAIDRVHLTDGMSLWLASHSSSTKTKLMHSSVAVVEDDEFVLKRNTSYTIRFEKISNHISVFINDTCLMNYTTYAPLVGTHVGIMSKDGDFHLENDLKISIASESLSLSCLSVPDAFLASKNYEKALSEYRRLGSTFAGYAEGREALFRAGVTLLERAKAEKDTRLSGLASLEFEKLRNTPGAPLEYLGKALIYESEQEYIDEVKCFEYALRRYKKHPLLPILAEQIILRMHETTRANRVIAYHFILLVARYLPKLATLSWSFGVFESLKRDWEQPPFLNNKKLEDEAERHRFCINLSFWLKKPMTIREIISDLVRLPILPVELIFDALYLLALMNEEKLHESALQEIRTHFSQDEQKLYDNLFLHATCTAYLPQDCDFSQLNEQTLFLACKRHKELPLRYAQAILNTPTMQLSEKFGAFLIEELIGQQNFDMAEKVLLRFESLRSSSENSPLFFARGCLYAHTDSEEKARSHFSTLFETAFPKTHLLGAHYINSTLSLRSTRWIDQSFWWEREELLRQLELFQVASKNPHYLEKAQELYQFKEKS